MLENEKHTDKFFPNRLMYAIKMSPRYILLWPTAIKLYRIGHLEGTVCHCKATRT